MTTPERAMILAAGEGRRMRPLTLKKPKPLIELAGQPMLDRAIDHVVRNGVSMIVVNTHWLGEQIEGHLAGRTTPRIVISRETTLLETGGGVAKALKNFADSPFYVVNSDVVWRDGATPALKRLASGWNNDTMDALLLLQPIVSAFGYAGRGDFLMDPLGQLTRRPEREIAPFVFTGVQIVHPRLFKMAPSGSFSMNLLYDHAAASSRLFGIAHDGDWYHVGTPEMVTAVEAEIREGTGSRVRILF